MSSEVVVSVQLEALDNEGRLKSIQAQGTKMRQRAAPILGDGI